MQLNYITNYASTMINKINLLFMFAFTYQG